MTDTNDETGFRAGPILLGLIGFLSFACIASGGFLYVWIVADYLADDSPFASLQMIGWVAGLFCTGVIGIGLLLAGILLRLVRWPPAPRASLGLAIGAVAFMIVTYLVFSDIDRARYSAEFMMLQGTCVAYLFLIALPPFLHWLKARPNPAIPERPAPDHK